jgi:hypothetical protein
MCFIGRMIPLVMKVVMTDAVRTLLDDGAI